MRREELLSELKGYVNDCYVLANDLSLVIEDLDFEINQEGELRYAVDIPEIYHYILPEPPRPEYLLFQEDSSPDSGKLRLLILNQMFYADQKKKVLLPPYRVELKGIVYQLQRNLLTNELEKVLKIFEETKILLQNSEIKKYADLDSESITETDAQYLLNLFEKYAPTILVFLEPIERPLERLKNLLASALIGEESLGHFDLNAFDDVFQRWYDRLIDESERRRFVPASSQLDAAAVSLLVQINQSLQMGNNPPTRLLLVTSSYNLLSVLDKEIQAETWPLELGNLLRHPRVFNLSRQGQEIPKKELRTLLSKQQNMVQDFLSKANEGLVAVDEEELEYFAKGIRLIKQDWRATQNLSVSLAEWQSSNALITEIEESTNKNSAKTVKAVQNIVNWIHKDTVLRKVVRRRLDQLVNDLETDHSLLNLGMLDEDQQKRLQTSLKPEVTDHGASLSANPQAIPYEIFFYKQNVRAIVQEVGQQGRVQWKTIVDLVDQTNLGAEYEPNLAIAWIWASINEWNSAEQFCIAAIAAAENKADSTLAYEGYFLLSICKRKTKSTLRRHLEALEHLKKAEELKYSLDLEGIPDPRFIAEKGCHILNMNLKFPDSKTLFPDAELGIALLDDSFDVLEKHPNILIRAKNNILFYRIESGDFNSVSQLNSELSEFVRLLHKHYGAESEWPAFALDTVAWVEWKLSDEHSEESKKRIKRLLNLAIKMPYLIGSEQRETLKHLSIVSQN